MGIEEEESWLPLSFVLVSVVALLRFTKKSVICVVFVSVVATLFRRGHWTCFLVVFPELSFTAQFSWFTSVVLGLELLSQPTKRPSQRADTS